MAVQGLYLAGASAPRCCERLGSLPATDDYDGGGADAEAAQDKGLAFYETMTAMRQATVNLFSGPVPPHRAAARSPLPRRIVPSLEAP